MEIMSIGKKIRTLRKKIGLRQDQLTDDLITRSLISMIENGKRNLNKKTATIIANKLNIYYENMGEKITADYLLESEEVQASNIIDSNIEELYVIIKDRKKFQEQRINDILKIAKELALEWKLPNKTAEINFFKAEYDYEFEKYSRAIMNYFSALEYWVGCREHDFVAEIYIKLSRCYFELGQLQEAIEYNQKASSIARENKTKNAQEIEIESLVNNIIYYTKSNRLDMALFSIVKIKKIDGVPQDSLFRVALYEANTHRELKNYEKARKIYNKLLCKEDKLKPELFAYAHLELSKLFKYTREAEKALQSCNDALTACEKMEESEPVDLLFGIAKQYFEIAKYEIALSVLDKAQKNAEDRSRLKYLCDILLYRAEVYKKIEEFKKSELDLLRVEKIMYKHNFMLDLHKLYASYSELYFEMGNFTKCKAYLGKIRKH